MIYIHINTNARAWHVTSWKGQVLPGYASSSMCMTYDKLLWYVLLPDVPAGNVISGLLGWLLFMKGIEPYSDVEVRGRDQRSIEIKKTHTHMPASGLERWQTKERQCWEIG